MSVVYMYHTENPDFASQCSTGQGNIISLLDHFCTIYGGGWAAIHPGDYQTHCPENYPSLSDAHLVYPNHTWVYLDPKGEQTLDEFQHPKDDVVYVVGHDFEGFRGVKFNGPSVRIENAHNDPDRESFAIACLIMVICDRWSRRWQ